ncbi:MAG: hypothetical protein WAV00_13015 [Nocardioides sp.]
MTDAPAVTVPMFVTSDKVILVGAVVLTALAGFADYGHWSSVVAFVVAAAAVAVLASLVGRSVEQLGDRFGAGATGVLQSALGNLPELFICIFSLKAGLVDVVQAALVGSILANLLLVLGLAFLVGGLKHGAQQLGSQRARTILVLMLLSVSAWALPSFTFWLHTPASAHEVTFSVIVSVLLIGLFVASLPFSLRREAGDEPPGPHEQPRWPIGLAVGLLAVAGVAVAFVSDWFVNALQPAMDSVVDQPDLRRPRRRRHRGQRDRERRRRPARGEGPGVVRLLGDPQQSGPDRAGAGARAGAGLADLRARLADPGAVTDAGDGADAGGRPGGVHRRRRGVELARGASLVVLYVIIATSFWWG